MKIAIENIRQLHNTGNLRAFCDVRIETAGGDWLIRSCKIVQQPGQRAWFSFPTVSWQNGEGKIHYKTLLEIPARLKKKISEAALEIYYESQAIAA